MKFLLDESVEYRLFQFLKELGYDVTAIGYNYPPSLKDSGVLAIANKEKRILLTNDRDFGELIFRQHLKHKGVIFFRLRRLSIQIKTALLEEMIAKYRRQLRKFIVITPQGVRIRKNVTK